MRTYSVYRVTGRRKYRSHNQGSLFEAALDPQAEQRAIRRGDIALIERITPKVQPGSYSLGDWPPTAKRREALSTTLKEER